MGLPVPIGLSIVVGALLAIGGMIGDLMESLIKRRIGIKDMSAIIPGHGGFMDRIDALLVTIPMAYYLALLSLARLAVSDIRDERQGVVILGSTGSIGRSTLNVIGHCPNGSGSSASQRVQTTNCCRRRFSVIIPRA